MHCSLSQMLKIKTLYCWCWINFPLWASSLDWHALAQGTWWLLHLNAGDRNKCWLYKCRAVWRAAMTDWQIKEATTAVGLRNWHQSWKPKHRHGKPGCPKLGYTDILVKDTGLEAADLWTAMLDRTLWRTIVVPRHHQNKLSKSSQQCSICDYIHV